MRRLEISSMVPASPEAVWTRVTTPAGINDELRPWLRMTVPPQLRGRTIDEVEGGEALGRSRLLLFGLVPVDYDDLFLAEVGPGYRFLERSEMLSMRVWEHERAVSGAAPGQRAPEENTPGGVRKSPAVAMVTDRLAFELRKPLASVPGAISLTAAVIRRLFRHRHARLAAYFRQY